MSGTTLLSQQATSEKREILIVDDDLIIHLLHRKVVELSQRSHPVSVHDSGRRVLDYILRKEDTSFLVLLDLNMPVMSGWDFLKECRERNLKKLYIAIVTSSTNAEDRLRSFDYPQVVAYCEKPFTKNKMGELLQLPELRPFSDLAEEEV